MTAAGPTVLYTGSRSLGCSSKLGPAAPQPKRWLVLRAWSLDFAYSPSPEILYLAVSAYFLAPDIDGIVY
jgi:hypothetical protein